jgi:isoleucyl-tRNA synthetase
VREEMKAYRLYTVVPKLLTFLDQLTNWYVRLNRARLKGEMGEQEWFTSLNVLLEVILNASILMAPYVP